MSTFFLPHAKDWGFKEPDHRSATALLTISPKGPNEFGPAEFRNF